MQKRSIKLRFLSFALPFAPVTQATSGREMRRFQTSVCIAEYIFFATYGLFIV